MLSNVYSNWHEFRGEKERKIRKPKHKHEHGTYQQDIDIEYTTEIEIKM